MNSLKTIRHLFRAAFRGAEEPDSLDKFNETLSPNVRAIRLSVGIADILVASGVPVSDVVSQALDITERYCQRKVQFDISMTVIMASQDRGNEREPLTMIRYSRSRTQNNMLVQSLQELVRDISSGMCSLDDAETRFDALLATPTRYPYWLTTIGSALISGGVGVMFGAKPIIIAIMIIVGAGVSYALRVLTHYRVPSFFAQVISAIAITLVAAFVTWASLSGVQLFANVSPTMIVIGGIVMLLAGLAFVGAVQDAIDEYYITANARLLKVFMTTAGVVAGVTIGLYVAKQLGAYIALDADSPRLGRNDMQIAGAVLISVGYALSTQSRKAGIALAGGMGALSWLCYMLCIHNMSPNSIVASALASAIVGFVGTMIARFWRTPSTALVMAGIVPLVPGLTLYNGLQQAITDFSNPSAIAESMTTLLSAAFIALAIASGASFGIFVGRPLRRTLVRARNALPRQQLRFK